MLLDEYGSFLLRRDVPHRQIISDSGWVGHDASEIAANIFRAVRLALQDAGVDPAQVAAVAVTNQRESVAVWDRRTGEPVCESIVWQCNRATELCRRLPRARYPPRPVDGELTARDPAPCGLGRLLHQHELPEPAQINRF